MFEGFYKQETEARRTLLSNSIGCDMAANTGRKENTRSHHLRIKQGVKKFGTLPERGYIQQIATELQN